MTEVLKTALITSSNPDNWLCLAKELGGSGQFVGGERVNLRKELVVKGLI